MTLHSYAAVHLTDSHQIGQGSEQRDVALARQHVAELRHREGRRRRVAPTSWLANVTRFVTRSRPSLTVTAAAGGTRRV